MVDFHAARLRKITYRRNSSPIKRIKQILIRIIASIEPELAEIKVGNGDGDTNNESDLTESNSWLDWLGIIVEAYTWMMLEINFQYLVLKFVLVDLTVIICGFLNQKNRTLPTERILEFYFVRIELVCRVLTWLFFLILRKALLTLYKKLRGYKTILAIEKKKWILPCVFLFILFNDMQGQTNFFDLGLSTYLGASRQDPLLYSHIHLILFCVKRCVAQNFSVREKIVKGMILGVFFQYSIHFFSGSYEISNVTLVLFMLYNSALVLLS